jgi:hypothetical protein
MTTGKGGDCTDTDGRQESKSRANHAIDLMKKNTRGELRAHEIMRRKPNTGYIDPTAKRDEHTT